MSVEKDLYILTEEYPRATRFILHWLGFSENVIKEISQDAFKQAKDGNKIRYIFATTKLKIRLAV